MSAVISNQPGVSGYWIGSIPEEELWPESELGHKSKKTESEPGHKSKKTKSGSRSKLNPRLEPKPELEQDDRAAVKLDDPDSVWNMHFQLILAYKNTFGDKFPPVYSAKPRRGYTLGDWMLTQRTNFRSGKLKAYQITRLKSLHNWSWS